MKTDRRLAIGAIVLMAAAFARPAFCSDLEVGDGANDNTYIDSGAYAAATKIVKSGTGKTTVDFGAYATKPDFTGEIEVQEGTLAVRGIPNLGTPTKITVWSGATLDLTTSETAPPTNLKNCEIEIAGAGVGGNGALIRGGTAGVNELFKTLTLAADATIQINKQIGLLANNGAIKLNGSTLTKTGTDKLYLKNITFKGSDGTTDDPGNVIVEAGTLFLQDGNAMAGGSTRNTITVADGAGIQVRNISTLRWSINALGSATILSDNTIGDSGRNTFSGPISAASSLTLNPNAGTTQLKLSGNSLTLGGDMTVNGIGPVIFTDVAVSNTAAGGVSIQHSSEVARLTLGGNTVMESATNGYGCALARIILGDTAGRRGVLEVGGNSVITNYGLAIGRSGIGALYQRGGVTYWPVSNASHDRSGNVGGAYGYLGITGGKFTLNASNPELASNDLATHFGTSGRFVMATHGGSADFVASGKVGLALRGGTVVYYQDGGTTNSFDDEFSFCNDSSRNYASHGFVTVSGKDTLLRVGSYLRSLLSNSGAETFVNINDGGTLVTKYIYRLYEALPFYLNLNGGILRPIQSNIPFTYKDEDARYPKVATVYEGGFTIDTSDTRNSKGEQASEDWFRVQFPLVAPGSEGKRIASIALPSIPASEKLVGSPVVVISGDGEGASAFALFDDATRTVTNIVVASPGWGYTTATASLVDGGLSTTYECEVTLADQPAEGWQGLRKRGGTAVEMYGANTFKGDVTVESGRLSFRNTSVAQGGMPEGAGIIVKDGAEISFNAAATPVTVPFIAGCGSTSYGAFTVTNRIECTADDIFAGRHLRVARNLTLSDGVKIVVTDPENLVNYRDGGVATVLEAGTVNGTLTCNDPPELAFGSECADESVEMWSVRKSGNRITMRRRRGIALSVR